MQQGIKINKIMGLLSDALDFVGRGRERALDVFNEAQRAFDELKFNEMLDTLIDKGNDFYNDFNELMDTIKDTVSDFKVVVPFNEKKESFDYEVKYGLLVVTVNSDDGKGFRETKTTVPSNCNVDEIRHVVNRKEGVVVVIIPKNISEDEKVKKFKSDAISKVKQTADKIRELADAVASSTSAPKSKGKTSKSTAHKVVRDEKGRFVAQKKA